MIEITEQTYYHLKVGEHELGKFEVVWRNDDCMKLKNVLSNRDSNYAGETLVLFHESTSNDLLDQFLQLAGLNIANKAWRVVAGSSLILDAVKSVMKKADKSRPTMSLQVFEKLVTQFKETEKENIRAAHEGTPLKSSRRPWINNTGGDWNRFFEKALISVGVTIVDENGEPADFEDFDDEDE